MTLPEFCMTANILALSSSARLENEQCSALYEHYTKRGCVVVDVDQHVDPLVSALPLIVSTNLWTQVRLEVLRNLIQQVSDLFAPAVFLNIRSGPETSFMINALPYINAFRIVYKTEDVLEKEFLPVVDLTHIYPHVLDSLF
jgi:hypothetical protein